MKRVLWGMGLVLAALAAPVGAAELKVLSPADRSVVRGLVEFRIQPIHGPEDQFLSNPYVTIKDLSDREMVQVRAPKNLQTGICSVIVDMSRYPDGQYIATVTYRTYVRNKAQEAREDLVLGVRNSRIRPARFSVQVEDRAYRLDEAADFTVKVLDSRGKPLAGARVALKTDQEDGLDGAEITDADGEATFSVQVEDPATVTVTITVENLAPVVKKIRFAQ